MAKDDLDIDSYIINRATPDKSESKEFSFDPNVRYPAKLAKVSVYDKKTKDGEITKMFRWFFELVGTEYATEWNGRPQQFSIMSITSTFCSPGSRMYDHYCSVAGVEHIDPEVDKVSMKSIIGKPVFIKIEMTAGKDKEGNPKTWYGVTEIKPGKAAKKEARSTENNNPDKVASPSDIEFESGKASEGRDVDAGSCFNDI